LRTRIKIVPAIPRLDFLDIIASKIIFDPLGDRQHIFEVEAAMGLRDYNSAAWTREGTTRRRRASV